MKCKKSYVVSFLILVGMVLGEVLGVNQHQKLDKKKNSLVNVHAYCKELVVDLCFSTTNNFIHKKLYSYNIPFLHKDAAVALAKAAVEFKKHGYRIFISDAYRPLSIQKELWDFCPDARYVANPYKGGSNHTRGVAVDITLIDAQGNKLAMPSEIDDMSEKAHRLHYDTLPAKTRENVLLLEKVMVQAGFELYKFEWWHFNLKGWKNYPPLDFSFEDLVEATKNLN